LSNNVVSELPETKSTEEDAAQDSVLSEHESTEKKTPPKLNQMINPNDTTFAAFSMFYEEGLRFGQYHQYGCVHTESQINDAFDNIKSKDSTISPRTMRAALKI
jgi:hypothetical protein